MNTSPDKYPVPHGHTAISTNRTILEVARPLLTTLLDSEEPDDEIFANVCEFGNYLYQYSRRQSDVIGRSPSQIKERCIEILIETVASSSEEALHIFNSMAQRCATLFPQDLQPDEPLSFYLRVMKRDCFETLIFPQEAVLAPNDSSLRDSEPHCGLRMQIVDLDEFWKRENDRYYDDSPLEHSFADFKGTQGREYDDLSDDILFGADFDYSTFHRKVDALVDTATTSFSHWLKQRIVDPQTAGCFCDVAQELIPLFTRHTYCLGTIEEHFLSKVTEEDFEHFFMKESLDSLFDSPQGYLYWPQMDLPQIGGQESCVEGQGLL